MGADVGVGSGVIGSCDVVVDGGVYVGTGLDVGSGTTVGTGVSVGREIGMVVGISLAGGPEISNRQSKNAQVPHLRCCHRRPKVHGRVQRRPGICSPALN